MRSVESNETCPFQMCHIKNRTKIPWRSPEESINCSNRTDGATDVFSLGSIFFFLLSDGRKPWYHMGTYSEVINLILKGEQPRLPNIAEYSEFGNETIAQVTHRLKHPAFIALKEIMAKCLALRPNDRPSSMQLVQMFEEKRHELSSFTAFENPESNSMRPH